MITVERVVFGVVPALIYYKTAHLKAALLSVLVQILVYQLDFGLALLGRKMVLHVARTLSISYDVLPFLSAVRVGCSRTNSKVVSDPANYFWLAERSQLNAIEIPLLFTVLLHRSVRRVVLLEISIKRQKWIFPLPNSVHRLGWFSIFMINPLNRRARCPSCRKRRTLRINPLPIKNLLVRDNAGLLVPKVVRLPVEGLVDLRTLLVEGSEIVQQIFLHLHDVWFQTLGIVLRLYGRHAVVSRSG